MKYFFILIFFIFLQDQSAAQARVIKFPELESLLDKKSDTVRVFNFWATWCVPCVEELPGFLKLEKELSGKTIRFYYISLDFKRNLVDRLIPFIKNNGMQNSTVYLLDEPDYNSWIDKVDPSWQGSIPATVIIKNDFYIFKETTLTYEQLNDHIKHLIK